MTTNVIVKAHAWPVEIKTIDRHAARDVTETTELLEAPGERTVYLTQTRSILLTEKPAREKSAQS